MLPSILKSARRVIAGSLNPGSVVVDGTAGLGRDTLFLARWVGPKGRVLAFDVQAQALNATRGRLAAAGLLDRVELIAQGHETIGDHVNFIDAAMFNLGYLPGSDRAVTTHPESSLAALDQVVARLTGRGVVTVVAYPGHPGGAEECSQVERWFQAQANSGQRVASYRFLTSSGTCPILFALEKRPPTQSRSRSRA